MKIFFPVVLFIFAVYSGFIIFRSTSFIREQHFSLLANSFAHHNLFLNPIGLPSGDFVDFRAKQYLYFGPIPSIILIPFVFIWGNNFPQMTLSIVSLIVIFVTIYLLSRNFKFSKIDSLWLTNFFVFGTVLFFVGLVDISAYVVQSVATALVIISLLEYFGKRRWFLMGLLIAAAGATRITLFGMSLFFLLELIRVRRQINFIKCAIYFMIPIIFSLSMLGNYNFRRFNSFFDTGYTRNVTNIWDTGDNHKLGYFSLKHIPANLYTLFFMAPEPVKRDGVNFALKFPYLKVNGNGLAIWFTSPLFIYLLMIRRKEYSINAFVAILALLIPSLVYFGIGMSQYGYRYSLDIIPLLFVLLLTSFNKKLPNFAKVLIFYGVVFNSLYMLSIWNIYPLFSFWKNF